MQEAPLARVIDAIVGMRAPALRSPYIQSISIARHGRLVLDEYFYGFTPDTPHDTRSAAKSVATLIVGRAIEDTRRFTPQSRVLSLLPSYLPVRNDDARKAAMTVADLMTMASGLACNDNDDSSPGNEDTIQSRPAGTNWYRYTLDLPMTERSPARPPSTVRRASICSARSSRRRRASRSLDILRSGLPYRCSSADMRCG